MARNTRAKITDDVENGRVSFDFLDGGEAFSVSLKELPKEIVRQLAVSRLHNKLMDTYADVTTSPRDEVMRAVGMLKAGEWSERGEGSPQSSILADAIVALGAAQGVTKTREEVLAFLEPMSKEERSALRKDPQIAAEIASIEAARKNERAKAMAAAAANAPNKGQSLASFLGRAQ